MRQKQEWKITGDDVPPEARRAIWLVHEKKCAYTGRELSFDELHIDHVIPKELNKEENWQRKAEILRELGLPDNFDLYELPNLVPTFTTYNRKKSFETDGIWLDSIRKVLPIAAKNAAAARQRWKELELKEKLSESVLKLSVIHLTVVACDEYWPDTPWLHWSAPDARSLGSSADSAQTSRRSVPPPTGVESPQTLWRPGDGG
jgi:hypothetical protein